MTDGASRELLLKDHRRVVATAEQLKNLLEEPVPPCAEILAKARWLLASALMQHLALKERYLYAKLEMDPRVEVQSTYGALKADLLQCFAEYTNHMERWPTARAFQEWKVYQPKAISVVNVFVRYLEREEAQLFDLIERLGIDISAPSPVTSNWVRSAFIIKDKVEDR